MALGDTSKKSVHDKTKNIFKIYLKENLLFGFKKKSLKCHVV